MFLIAFRHFYILRTIRWKTGGQLGNVKPREESNLKQGYKTKTQCHWGENPVIFRDRSDFILCILLFRFWFSYGFYCIPSSLLFLIIKKKLRHSCYLSSAFASIISLLSSVVPFSLIHLIHFISFFFYYFSFFLFTSSFWHILSYSKSSLCLHLFRFHFFFQIALNVLFFHFISLYISFTSFCHLSSFSVFFLVFFFLLLLLSSLTRIPDFVKILRLLHISILSFLFTMNNLFLLSCFSLFSLYLFLRFLLLNILLLQQLIFSAFLSLFFLFLQPSLYYIRVFTVGFFHVSSGLISVFILNRKNTF